MNALTIPILTPAERARLGLDDLDDAWCSRCEAHRNSVTGAYTLHMTIMVRVSATAVSYAGTIIRGPALTKSGYDDEMFTNTSR